MLARIATIWHRSRRSPALQWKLKSSEERMSHDSSDTMNVKGVFLRSESGEMFFIPDNVLSCHRIAQSEADTYARNMKETGSDPLLPIKTPVKDRSGRSFSPTPFTAVAAFEADLPIVQVKFGHITC
jgi:hypothetical protein